MRRRRSKQSVLVVVTMRPDGTVRSDLITPEEWLLVVESLEGWAALAGPGSPVKGKAERLQALRDRLKDLQPEPPARVPTPRQQGKKEASDA